MKSRIPSDKVLDTYKSIAKDIVDPSTTFVVKNVDGKTRLVTEKSTPYQANKANPPWSLSEKNQ
jgi:hypothetical protein